MKCTEEYLDDLLGRESIELARIDKAILSTLGFEPRIITDGDNTVVDMMARCPCDQGRRWRFYIAIAESGDGTGILYGFRDGMLTLPGFEYREFNDMRRMSKFNANQDVDAWMVDTLRSMIEQDAIEPKGAVA